MRPEDHPETIPPRLIPLVEQFDFACERLINRMAGPEVNSGDGVPVPVTTMGDEEYLWAPVPQCWTIRPRTEGPGPGATELAGASDWGRDRAERDPYPPPFTTIAWRLAHLGEMLTLRADHTIGTHSLTRNDYPHRGDAAGAIAAFAAAADRWREAVTSADDAALDQVGRSGRDPDNAFIDIVWWVNQEVLHHGAEIALLRDLYRSLRG
ncbi:MAG: DinB family protein [Chloroflexi bacterium]|nr:DinB family protein [Chloroflexota bacterium]